MYLSQDAGLTQPFKNVDGPGEREDAPTTEPKSTLGVYRQKQCLNTKHASTDSMFPDSQKPNKEMLSSIILLQMTERRQKSRI